MIIQKLDKFILDNGIELLSSWLQEKISRDCFFWSACCFVACPFFALIWVGCMFYTTPIMEVGMASILVVLFFGIAAKFYLALIPKIRKDYEKGMLQGFRNPAYLNRSDSRTEVLCGFLFFVVVVKLFSFGGWYMLAYGSIYLGELFLACTPKPPKPLVNAVPQTA